MIQEFDENLSKKRFSHDFNISYLCQGVSRPFERAARGILVLKLIQEMERQA